MDLPSWVSIGLILLLLITSAYFSALETAFSSVSKIRAKHYAETGVKNGKILLTVVTEFERTITTILITNNVVNILNTAITTAFLSAIFGPIGGAYAVLLMSILIIFFAEILPKTYARTHADKFALRNAARMMIFMKLIHFLLVFVNGITKFLSNLLKLEKNNEPTISEDELLTIMDTIEEEGVIEEDEKDLIQSAIEFSDSTVKDIQTPRVDIIAIDVNQSIDFITQSLMSHPYSRIPIYENSIDNIIGILHEKRFMQKRIVDTDFNVRDLITEPLFVSETTSLMDALQLLQIKKVHIAVVIDEYGGTSGIVTLEDILEELVGDIYDEHDDVIEYFKQLEPNHYLASGNVELEELFEDHLESKFVPSSKYNTLSGWLYECVDGLPEVGSIHIFDEFEFKVSKIISHRVAEVEIRRLNKKEIENEQIN